MEPCSCQESFDKAIPAIFANRRQSAQDAAFNEILPNLVRRYADENSVPAREKAIFWTVYELGSADIVNALLYAHARGLKVEVLTDGKSLIQNPGSDGDERSFQRQMLKDAADRLRAAGVTVRYSNPDFTPRGNLYPRIMHEKIRLFARKIRNRWQPLFAYISTHNDSYSEMRGDPLESLSMERIREGRLLDEEMIAGSRGNVQTSFILREQRLLQEIFANFRAQMTLYGLGVGHIQDLPQRKPLVVDLEDGTQIRMGFTFGRRSALNPNEWQAQFYDQLSAEGASVQANIRLTEFVFTYGKVEEALKTLVGTQSPPIVALVDQRSAFQPYTQARAMAGLFSLTDYIPSRPIDYPWKKSLREKVIVKSYNHPHDRLHLKNSLIRYRRGRAAERYRIYTGSLNLSSNGAANKEIFFEIDTASKRFLKVMDDQWEGLSAEGNIKDFAMEALLNRLKGVGSQQSWIFKDEVVVEDSLRIFMGRLAGAALDASLPTLFPNPQAPQRLRWVNALGEFYKNATTAVDPELLLSEVELNLAETVRFYPGLSNVEFFLNLNHKPDMSPAIRQAILNLYQEPEALASTEIH